MKGALKPCHKVVHCCLFVPGDTFYNATIYVNDFNQCFGWNAVCCRSSITVRCSVVELGVVGKCLSRIGTAFSLLMVDICFFAIQVSNIKSMMQSHLCDFESALQCSNSPSLTLDIWEFRQAKVLYNQLRMCFANPLDNDLVITVLNWRFPFKLSIPNATTYNNENVRNLNVLYVYCAYERNN